MAISVDASDLLTTRGLMVPRYPTLPYSLHNRLIWAWQGPRSSYTTPSKRVSWEGEESPPPWLSAVVVRLAHLLTLRSNWDTYGGQPVASDAINKALHFLGEHMRPETQAPWI